jgi:hypothetical protein
VIRRDAASRPRLTPRGRTAARSAAVAVDDWLATHGPGLVVVLALAAVALLTGAADAPGDSWLSTGGVGAVVGAVLTWASTYRARQAQAQRVESRAHEGAYEALGGVIEGLRGELGAVRTDLAAARVEASAARDETARIRAELERAERRLADIRQRERAMADAISTLDARTRHPGEPSVSPPAGVRAALDESSPGADGLKKSRG